MPRSHHKKGKDGKVTYATEKAGNKANTAYRSRTNKARKDVGLKKGDPREVDHTESGGKVTSKRITSRKANRTKANRSPKRSKPQRK